MAYSIDPVTGLPLLQDTNIDQIPLNAQVFPYDDLHAVQRPIRGPAYPDDVLPTTAIVVGMDTTNPQQPQTVTTDGEHALRVYVVNPKSGGGAGPAVQVFGDGNVVNAITSWNNVEAGDATIWDGDTKLIAPAKGSYLIYFSQEIEPSPGGSYSTDGAAYQVSCIIYVNGRALVIEDSDHDFSSTYFTFGHTISDRVSGIVDLQEHDYVQFAATYNTEDMTLTDSLARAYLARVM